MTEEIQFKMSDTVSQSQAKSSVQMIHGWYDGDRATKVGTACKDPIPTNPPSARAWSILPKKLSNMCRWISAVAVAVFAN